MENTTTLQDKMQSIKNRLGRIMSNASEIQKVLNQIEDEETIKRAEVKNNWQEPEVDTRSYLEIFK